MTMINLGYDTYVPVEKIKAVMPYESARIHKEVARLRDSEDIGRIIDASRRKTIKSVIILDDGCYIICMFSTATIIKRINEIGGLVDD